MHTAESEIMCQFVFVIKDSLETHSQAATDQQQHHQGSAGHRRQHQEADHETEFETMTMTMTTIIRTLNIQKKTKMKIFH